MSSPDPTIKALKAGEELIDALDHAFAEFENERLEINPLLVKEDNEVEKKKEDGYIDVIALETKFEKKEQSSSRAIAGSSPQKSLVSSLESRSGSGSGSGSGSSSVEDSEVSDELNTEKVLEQELERRVTEWIQKVEPRQEEQEEEEETSRGQNSHQKDTGSVVQEQEVEENNVSSIMTTATPCKESKSVSLQNDTVPLTSIKPGRLVEQLVSPLAVVDGDFEHEDTMCHHGESTESTVLKEKNPVEGEVVDLKDELKLEMEEQPDDHWDQDNQWDFDDVDSLPSEDGAENSNVDDVDDVDVAVTSSFVDSKENTDATSQKEDPVNGNVPVQELKSHPKLAVQTRVEECDGGDKISDRQDESPSPNDVVASLPFFNSQHTNHHHHQEDCCCEEENHDDNGEKMKWNMDEFQQLLQKEKDMVSQLQCELHEETSKRKQVEQELLKLKEEYSHAQTSYQAERYGFHEEYNTMAMKLEAAEKDAQEAIVLAEEAANGRSEMEGYLQRALDELESLKRTVQELGQEQQPPLPIIKEHDMSAATADVKKSRDDLSSQTPVRSSPRRVEFRKAGISAGRHLLRQAMDNDDVSFSSTQDGNGSVSSTQTDSTYYMMLCRRSSEKRQRLLDRIRNAKDDTQSNNDADIALPMEDGFRSGKTNSKLNKMLKTVELVIRKSGKSLGLGGRWFCVRPTTTTRPWKPDGENEDVETMAKSYCNAVEALIANQKDELNELRAFCQYLEDKMSET